MDEFQEQQVTLKDYVRILYRGRWIIGISFVVVMAATIYFTFTSLPVYEASALVMIKSEGGMQQQIFEISSYMNRATSINNQVEILKSRTLAENVIRRLQESDYADSLWILGSHKKEDGFSLKKTIKGLLTGNGNGHEEPSPQALFAGYVQSFRNSISVTPRRDTDLIELKVQSYDPVEASYIANTWMEAYRDLDISASRGEVSEIKRFLEVQLDSAQSKLAISENSLKLYKEDESVSELTAETQQLIEQAAEFETQYQTANTELQSNEKRLSYLRAQLSESQKAIMQNSLSSPVILEMEKQLAEQIAELASMEQQLKESGIYSEDNSIIKTKQTRLRGLQQKIIEEKSKMVNSGLSAMDPMLTSQTLLNSILELETENTSLKAKTAALRKISRDYSHQLDSLPEKTLRLARLQREVEVNSNIVLMLRSKYEENRILEAGQIGLVRPVDSALPPEEPIKPNKKMNLLLGFMVGLGLGVGIVFVREYMDTSVRSIEDIEREGLTVLGSIPMITPQRVSRHIKGMNGNGGGGITDIESRLVTHLAPKSPISEAYRSLRTNIQYTRAEKPIKTVVVTSSGPGEGKSTSTANLAITLAQMGVKTLLIDTDLRRPVQHGIFGVDRSNGLTNVLVGKVTTENAIRPTKIEGLDLLTAGTLPPNPSELLGSKTMEKFIEKVSEIYDMVLFDSPPVIAVTDSAVLASKLDGVILVVKSGETNRDAMSRARVLLQNVHANILGIMLNGVNVENMYGSYYYYYHYYYYGEGKNGKKSKRKVRHQKVDLTENAPSN